MYSLETFRIANRLGLTARAWSLKGRGTPWSYRFSLGEKHVSPVLLGHRAAIGWIQGFEEGQRVFIRPKRSRR